MSRHGVVSKRLCGVLLEFENAVKKPRFSFLNLAQHLLCKVYYLFIFA